MRVPVRLLATTRPLSGPGRWLRAAPLVWFAAFAAVAVGAGWLNLPSHRRAAVLAVLLAASVAVILAMLALPWHRWREGWQAAVPLGYFGLVVLLDYGGGLYYLAALPILWLALFHSRRLVLVGIAVFAATLFPPRLLFPDAFPINLPLAELVLVFSLIAIAGLAMQAQVEYTRAVAAASAAAARQARTDRDLLDAYLDHAPSLVIVVDPESRVLLYNRVAEEVLGYRAEEVIGQRAYYGPDEDPSSREAFERVLAGDWPQTRESDTRTRSGEKRCIAWSTTALTDPSGQVTRVISIGLDVTEQRGAEREAAAAMSAALAREREAAERLRLLDQVKNDFVATVSHDLRTPLTSIIGNAELLLDGDAGELSTLQARLLRAVERNARRLDTLVGDLLLLSRIESGALRMHPRAVAVNEILDGALEALGAKIGSDVRLEVQTPPEPVLVQADPEQLERVATNLLGNALKFTPPGGRVTATLTADDARVRLRVADTGIGIPAEELPHVFDRFFRSSLSQKHQSPGTGLGLTIAKSIVEHHGGTIEASSNPGGGTVFTVMLPRLPAAPLG